MGIGDFKSLKELSWYATVPLFVCAWLIQDFYTIQNEFTTVIGFVSIVSSYFGKVLAALFLTYVIWLILVSKLENEDFIFTLLLATFLLTLAAAGFGIYFLKPIELTMPVNIIWFAALASVAFNLYEINHSRAKAMEEMNKNKNT
jgi:hypothetical protein